MRRVGDRLAFSNSIGDPSLERAVASTFGVLVSFADFVPIHHVPEGFEVFGAAILVFEVVSVFPNVATQNRNPRFFVHERIILIGRRTDFQLAVSVDEQPNPSAAKPGNAGGFEFFFEGVKAAKSRLNIFGQGAGRRASGVGSENLPEKGVIRVAAAVVAHGVADVFRDRMESAEQFAEGFACQFRASLKRGVEFRHISPVMFAVVNLHGSSVDMGFQGVRCVRKGR